MLSMRPDLRKRTITIETYDRVRLDPSASVLDHCSACGSPIVKPEGYAEDPANKLVRQAAQNQNSDLMANKDSKEQ